MIQHTFKVKESEESTTVHEVTVSVPTYEEATEAQRKNLYDEGLASVTIKAQGTCRRRLGKGVRGEALNAEAQEAFNAIINGQTRRASAVVVDAKALRLSWEQIAGLEKFGATVINKPADTTKPAEPQYKND